MEPHQSVPHPKLPDLRGLADQDSWLLLDGTRGERGMHGILSAGTVRSLTVDSVAPDAFERVNAFVGAAGGRCMGWIGYDQLRADPLLELPEQGPTAVALPLVHWVEPAGVLAFRLGEVPTWDWLREPEDDALRAAMEGAVRHARPVEEPSAGTATGSEVTSSLDRADYLDAFRKVHRHILRGDIYELNLCRELSGRLPEEWDAADAFARLVGRTSAPYSSFMALGGCHILSASPECFLEKTGQRLVSRPIKGTAPRHADAEQDAMVAEGLRTDPKERAENVMITDLVRNDLSRVAAPASVEVEELCGIHSFRNVHQMISTVACTLRDDAGFADIMRATFPMGSMTGAPKLRAVEITAEVEPVLRGLYSGTAGWAEPDGKGGIGDFHLNVVIRTILADGDSGRWSAHVGGAITALALPENEWEETQLKARSLLEVLGAGESVVPAHESRIHG